MDSDLTTLTWLIPEIWLIALASGILVSGAFFGVRRIWWGIAAAGIVVAAGLICWLEANRWMVEASTVRSGPLMSDPLGFLWRHLALLAGFLLVCLAVSHSDERFQPEIQGLLLLVTVGMMLAARANELAFGFLALELVSVPTYALLYLGGRHRANAEAAVKYFYLSILSSAAFLLGLGYLYGAAGTTWIQLPDAPCLQQALPSAGQFAVVGLTMVLVGLGFKVAAVPFHFYAPDVYQGTSYANVALLSVAPKLAGFAVMIRLLVVGFQTAPDMIWPVLVVLSAVTMTLGNVCALWQRSLRRLMAYSSIAHSGFLLIGIAASASGRGGMDFGGVAAVSFYLFAYAFASIGFLGAASGIGSAHGVVDSIEHVSGFSRQHPWHAAALALFLLSLAGVPPLAGFWAKLGVFLSALSEVMSGTVSRSSYWLLGLAVLGAVNAAIGAAYYLRVVSVMYFGSIPQQASLRPNFPWPLQAAVVLCAVWIIGLGIHQQPLSAWSLRAEQGLRSPATLSQPEARSATTARPARQTADISSLH